MPDPLISQDDATATIKELSKKWLMFVAVASIVGLTMFAFWPYISESVRNYDSVRSIPDIEKRVSALRDEVRALTVEQARLKRELEDIQSFFPRQPSVERFRGWETHVKPALRTP